MSEMIPEYGGCLWPIDESCLGPDWEELSEAAKERALALASATLRRLTAYRVGGCPVTVRPCSPGAVLSGSRAFTGAYGTGWEPSQTDSGGWVNSCGCGSSCGCEVAASITLPGPVGLVYEVKVDGVVLPPPDYRVDAGNRLVWIGVDPSPFPARQNLSLPDSEPNTFSITYLNAYPVDSLGAAAAGRLAYEFAQACKPKGKCSLPRDVVEVTRNGTTFNIEAGLFPNGRTGIDIVDGFIDIWNPDHRTQQTRVWTPSGNRFSRTGVGRTGGILDGGAP